MHDFGASNFRSTRRLLLGYCSRFVPDGKRTNNKFRVVKKILKQLARNIESLTSQWCILIWGCHRHFIQCMLELAPPFSKMSVLALFPLHLLVNYVRREDTSNPAAAPAY